MGPVGGVAVGVGVLVGVGVGVGPWNVGVGVGGLVGVAVGVGVGVVVGVAVGVKVGVGVGVFVGVTVGVLVGVGVGVFVGVGTTRVVDVDVDVEVELVDDVVELPEVVDVVASLVEVVASLVDGDTAPVVVVMRHGSDVVVDDPSCAPASGVATMTAPPANIASRAARLKPFALACFIGDSHSFQTAGSRQIQFQRRLPSPAIGALPALRRPPRWWGWALLGIVLVAALVRTVGLGDRPMHHDESLDAWFSWSIGNGEPYQYDPVYHGPLRFYLTAFLYDLFGTTEAIARTTAAAAGVAVVALIGTTRRWLGDIGSLAAAAIVAISPSMVYFSRFGREDSLMALLELLLLLTAMAWLTRPARWQPVAAGFLLACAFATKETTFIVGAVVAGYFVVLTALQWWRRRDRPAAPPASVVAAFRGPGWKAWAAGVAVFALVFAALFSVWFSHPGGIVDGAIDGIDYWLSQQPVNRGGMPWPFYLVLLAGYEWPTVVLAVFGAVAVVRRRDPALGLVLWMAVANLAVYSWASERFPWLLVHPLLPICLLAGLGVDRLATRAGLATDPEPTPETDTETETAAPRRDLVPLAVGAVLVVIISGVNLARVVFLEPSEPRQLLSAVQSTDELLDVRRRVEAIVEAAPADAPPRIVVDTSESAAWPWAWYLRDLPVAYDDLSVRPESAAGADVVLAMAANVPALESPAEGWVATPYAHRSWWVPEFSEGSPADWAGWLATRRTFSPTGSTNGVLLTRAGLAGT